MPKIKCEDCGNDLVPTELSDCETCGLLLCETCAEKHMNKEHFVTFRATDDPTYRAENPFESL